MKGLINVLNSKGRGVDDYSLINEINTMIKTRKEAAQQTLLISEKDLFDDAILSARNGEIEQSAKSILKYQENIQAQIESEFLTPFEGSEKIKEIDRKAADENMIGQIRAKIAIGKHEDVIKVIQKMTTKVSKGRTVDEHETLLKVMTSEITTALNLNSKLESVQEDAIKEEQTSNFLSLYRGITTPGDRPVTETDIINSYGNQTISESQRPGPVSERPRSEKNITSPAHGVCAESNHVWLRWHQSSKLCTLRFFQ